MIPADLVQVKYEFYRRLRQRVEDLLGQKSPMLKAYERVYQKELDRSRWLLTTPQDFFKELYQRKIVLIGDFHAHPQSARTVLRVCRKLSKVSSKMVLGLECFDRRHQDKLNLYMQGVLSEKDFLRSVEWQKQWGFPWEYMRPLLKWAMQHKVSVVALNESSVKSLKKRDQLAAEIIQRVYELEKPDHFVIQYGDLHLASAHLPYEIEKKLKRFSLKPLVLLQSPESIYFRVLKKRQDLTSVDFLRLGPNRWSVMSMLPWVKWQDYLLYLETGTDRRISSRYEDDDFDLTDHVAQMIKVLEKVLKIHVSTDALSVYSVNDPYFVENFRHVSVKLQKKIKEDILNGVSFYCPELQAGFLARPSLNHISRLASQYILFKLSLYRKTQGLAGTSFLQMIWLEMLIYFLSKVVNPKRKSDTIDDIRKALLNQNFGEKKKDVLMIALEQKRREMRYSLDHRVVRGGASLSSYSRVLNRSYQSAALLLGGMLGEKVYSAFHKKIVSWKQLEKILFRPLDHKNFKVVYYDTVEMIDAWPDAFQSKFDRF